MNCSICNKEITDEKYIVSKDDKIICLDCCQGNNYNTNIESKKQQESNYIEQYNINNTETDEKCNEECNLKENLKSCGLDKRISIWKEKLIDLSKRNRLLNFKHTKGSTLKIIDEIPPEIFKLLYCKNEVMQFLPIKVNAEDIPEEEKLTKEELNEGIEFKAQEFETYEINNLKKKHIDKFLQTNLSNKDMDNVLRKISTTAKNSMDDLGFNVLFLTLGSIIWYEREDSDVKFESPLLLLPIRISRKNVGEPFTIEYNDDEVILNPALALKFKKEFQINLDDIDISEIKDTDIVKIFETVQNKIKKQKSWKLLNNIYIGLFSFAKFVMYKDLDKYQDKIKNSYLVKCICGKEEQHNIDINKECPLKDLDTNVLPQDTYQILDADSSQQQAIAFVKAGNNLVIEGPPGTGKSQTIANIIAELLSQGKKVLFVSQKIAALEVVQNRLESNGLAPFCLELHSNKTNRKQVLENLHNALNSTYAPSHTGTSLEILQNKKIELNDYVNTIHNKMGILNKSPYEAMGIICKNKNIPDLECIFDNYDNWDTATFNYKKSLFTNLKNIVNILGNPKEFSWFGSHLKNLDSDYRLKLSIKEKLKNLSENISKLQFEITNLEDLIYYKKISKFDEIEKLTDIANLILNIPQNTFKTVSFDNENLTEDINKICECIRQFNIYNNRIKEHYNLGILNEDIESLIIMFENFNKKFLNKISIDYIKNKNHIRKFFINHYSPSSLQILLDLKNLKELKYWLEEINKNNTIAENIFNELWNKENSDESNINASSNSILKLKKILYDDIFTTNIITQFKENGINYDKIKILVKEITEEKLNITKNIEDLSNLILFDFEEAFGCLPNNTNIKTINNKYKNMLDDIDNLTIWSQYLNAIEKIEEENLNIFYNKFLKANIDFNLIDTTFEVQFFKVWLFDFAYQKSNILREFNAEQHNQIISQFRQLDKSLIENARIRLIERLSMNLINGKNSYPKELADLEHECKLQRLRKSLRQIIHMMPNLLLSVKPCLMMSPLTVSQLLDPELFSFDYIIFDEASQLTTEDCIGAMIRGKKLIVAGDSNQLPPTSFFKTVTEPTEDVYENTDEDYEKEDLDSILDECSTSGFPKCMLKWHYRSRDEHLIAFSNKHLYRELYTFPSAVETSDSMGIKWHYHEKTASTDTNARLEEAKIVAQAVLEHARRFPNRSLGVATFNIKQKDLIEDEIENLLNKDRSCIDFFSSNKKEPFFVKNLESIQGDERDVIIISMGYFKNQNNVLRMHFGPLNLDGGERRLNVLVTRARYKIELISAIRYVDFDLDKTNSRGVALLKQYLEYAERGEVALLSNTQTEIDDHFDSPFEEAVCQELRKAGLAIKTQVGCSGYKIDMAVRDEKNPGEFILGIECDGASYHSSATARDRDRLRQQVLESLGWKFYRIWSTDWFKNPQRELDKLLTYIKNLQIKNDLMTETTNKNL